MTCLEVRDLLPEFALDALGASEGRDVERHLEDCGGCRKEAETLREGAAALALGLPVALPPVSLEERVATRLGPRVRSGGRGVLRVLVAATLVLALLAVGSLGWAVAMRGRVHQLQDRVNSTELNVHELTRLLHAAKIDGTVRQAELIPTDGSLGGATAAIVIAPGSNLVVAWAALPKTDVGPFSVVLRERDGGTISAGRLTATSSGLLVLPPSYFGQSLAGVTAVLIMDGTGRALLSGPVVPYSSSG